MINRRKPSGPRMDRRRRKPCRVCKDSNCFVDYKNISLLRHYISDRGKIRSRRVTGLCTKHQRVIAGEIKKARQLALLPFTADVYR